jgi:hypothetical protein
MDMSAARRPSPTFATDVILVVGASLKVISQPQFWSTRRSRVLSCHLAPRLSLQISLVGRDRFLIPFKTNARHVRNVKQSATNFIGLLQDRIGPVLPF